MRVCARKGFIGIPNRQMLSLKFIWLVCMCLQEPKTGHTFEHCEQRSVTECYAKQVLTARLEPKGALCVHRCEEYTLLYK